MWYDSFMKFYHREKSSMFETQSALPVWAPSAETLVSFVWVSEVSFFKLFVFIFASWLVTAAGYISKPSEAFCMFSVRTIWHQNVHCQSRKCGLHKKRVGYCFPHYSNVPAGSQSITGAYSLWRLEILKLRFSVLFLFCAVCFIAFSPCPVSEHCVRDHLLWHLHKQFSLPCLPKPPIPPIHPRLCIFIHNKSCDAK